MTSKLRIRIGEVEIEYEGSEEFLKQELPQLLTTAMELRKAADASGSKAGAGGGEKKGASPLGAATTATIAARLKVKSGPDLLIAAAARLTLIQNKDTFTRQELLAEMQTASSYYKKSYSNNLSSYLSGCVSSGDLTETARHTYALGATKKESLEAQLANA